MHINDTPTSKSSGKRAADSIEGLGGIHFELGEGSATKDPKIPCLMIDELDG